MYLIEIFELRHGKTSPKNWEFLSDVFHLHVLFIISLQLIQNQGKETKKEVAEDGSTVNKTEDVLIKVIRVIANLSINENVGPVICSNYQCVDFLLKVLGTDRI